MKIFGSYKSCTKFEISIRSNAHSLGSFPFVGRKPRCLHGFCHASTMKRHILMIRLAMPKQNDILEKVTRTQTALNECLSV